MSETPKDPLDEILAGGLGEWFKGRKLEDLEIAEVDGEALFPDVITRTDFVNKRLYEAPVYMRIPLPHERGRARVAALMWMATEAKRSPSSFTWADAEAIFGAKYAAELEHIEVLARSLRKRSDPTQQYMTAEKLQKCHPAPALWDAKNRLDAWQQMSDLRINESELDESKCWALAAAVAKAGNLGPLVVIDGPALVSFVIFMASRLSGSRTAQPSPPSAEKPISTE